MPRELYLLTPEPVQLEALVAAAAGVDDSLLLRGLYSGAALQLVGADDRAVLTIENSRLLADPFDARRVTRGLDAGEGEMWWTEAVVPWGAAGDPGVAVVDGVARLLRGQLRVEDGR
jgi:hypothetical protein